VVALVLGFWLNEACGIDGMCDDDDNEDETATNIMKGRFGRTRYCLGLAHGASACCSYASAIIFRTNFHVYTWTVNAAKSQLSRALSPR